MSIIRRSLVTSRRAGGLASTSSGTSSGRGVVPGGIGGHYLHHDFASTNSSRTGATSRSNTSRAAPEEAANSSVNNSRERLSELSTRIDDLIQYQREVETEMNANISSYAQRDRLRNLIGSRTSSARIHLVDLASSPPSRPVLTRPPLHPSSTTTTNSTAPLTSSSTTTTTTTTTTETSQLPHDDIDRFERLENYRRLRRFAYNTRSSRSSSSSSIPTQSSSRPATSDLLNDNHNSSSTSGLSGRYNPSQSSESSRTRAERSRFDKTN